MCISKCSICLLMLISLPINARDVVMIINPANKTTSLNQKELQKIYLNKKTRWGSGERIVAVTLQSGEAHVSFLKHYLRKNERQFSIFWKRLLFTGKGVPPTSFANEEELMAFVAQTPGAIGYVSGKADLKGVIVLQIRNDSS